MNNDCKNDIKSDCFQLYNRIIEFTSNKVTNDNNISNNLTNFLIVIDLDYTIWPLYCYENTLPPYKLQPCLSNDYPRQLTCFSKPNRNIITLSIFKEAYEIITWCKDNNIMISICSKSPDIKCAKEILMTLNLFDIFKYPQIYQSNKRNHMKALCDLLDIKYIDMLFFDDDMNNIKSCETIGVTCIQVDKTIGLSWNNLKQGLNKHYNRLTNKSSLDNWLKPKRNNIIDNDSEDNKRIKRNVNTVEI